MDVTQLPFNRLIGLEAADSENGFLVSLPEDPRYTNHLGTVHASALLAVAEAGSGASLIAQLGDPTGLLAVVRRVEAKCRGAARGRVSARAKVDPSEAARWGAELSKRGRLSANVFVEIVDASGAVVLTAAIEWFIRFQVGDVPRDA